MIFFLQYIQSMELYVLMNDEWKTYIQFTMSHEQDPLYRHLITQI